MEFITSFLATTPIALFLLPVVIILVVLLVVLNKSHQVEAVTPVPLAPVTTTPAPALPTEVVSQVINNQTAPQSVEAPTPNSQPEVVPVQVEALQTEHVFTAAPVAEVTAQEVVEATVVSAPSWRPNPEVSIVEEVKPEVESVVAPKPVLQVPASPVESLPSEVLTVETPTVEVTENLPITEQIVAEPAVLPRAPII